MTISKQYRDDLIKWHNLVINDGGPIANGGLFKCVKDHLPTLIADVETAETERDNLHVQVSELEEKVTILRHIIDIAIQALQQAGDANGDMAAAETLAKIAIRRKMIKEL